MRHALIALAAALLAPGHAWAGDLIWDQVGSPVAPGKPSSDFVAPWESWDIEVADDFELVGVVNEVWALGDAGPFLIPGVWVRFYHPAPGGGPGALLLEQFYNTADPNVIANHDIVHVILPEPLAVNGRLFVSVQQKLNSGSSNPSVAAFWTWNGTLNGYPNGDPSYTRNPGGGWGNVCPTWCQTGADRIFKLYGEAFEPPPPPPPPAPASVQPTTVRRSGRFIVQGANFTAAEAEHQLLLNGAPAPHASWTDTEIHGYVPGDAPLGPAAVQVVTAGGASTTLAIQIEPMEPRAGRVRWRFQADHINVSHRAGIGADGTAYFSDSGGDVYAVGPDGGLKWIFNMVGGGNEGPVAVGGDGTIYAAGNPLGPDVNIHAINPDGSLRWIFTDTNTQSLIAGPTIGPDGNLYAVTDIGGVGAVSFAPAGQMLWSNPGSPILTEYAQVGAEIVFGPSQPGGPLDRFYVAFDELNGFDDRLYGFALDGQQIFSVVTGTIDDPAQTQTQAAASPQGPIYVTDFGPGGGMGWRLKSFSPETGALNWTALDQGTNTLSVPEVGPDGTVYVVRNFGHLHALDPDGSQRWVRSDASIYDAPVVRADNAMMLIAGVPDFGMPGFMQAVDPAGGSVLWQVDLPAENGGNIVASSRAIVGPGGGTAFFGAAYLSAQPQGQYSYLYAIDLTEPATPGDANGDGVVNVADIVAVVLAWGPCATCPEDLNGDGAVDVLDLVEVVLSWS
jgi:outer membrane protein assembly factor BamB